MLQLTIGTVNPRSFRDMNRVSTMPQEYFKDVDTRECPSVQAAFRSKEFWLMLLMLSISAGTLCATLVVDFLFAMAYKEIGIRQGYGDSFLTAVGCLFSIGNASGRIIWGTLYETFPFKNLYSTLLIGQSFFPLTLPLIASVRPLFGMWVFCTAFCSGGNFTIFPPCTNDVFGLGVGGIVYSYLATCFSWGAFILLFGNLFVLPYLGYSRLVVMAGVISSTNFLLLYVLNVKPKWTVTTIGLVKKNSIDKPLLAELKEGTEIKNADGNINRAKSFI